MRIALAPNALRTAISCCRATARDSRLAIIYVGGAGIKLRRLSSRIRSLDVHAGWTEEMDRVTREF